MDIMGYDYDWFTQSLDYGVSGSVNAAASLTGDAVIVRRRLPEPVHHVWLINPDESERRVLRISR